MMLIVKDSWERLFDRDHVAALEAVLPSALSSARWYGGKARTIGSVRIQDTISLRTETNAMVMAFMSVSYEDGGHATYTMVFSASFDEPALRIERSCPQSIVTGLAIAGSKGERRGVLHDALWDHNCAGALLQAIKRGQEFRGKGGTLLASPSHAFSDSTLQAASAESSVLQGEQSNTSVRFGRHAMMKLYRRFEPGLNPDLEIGRALTMRGYAHSPAVLGSLEYDSPDHDPATVAIVHAFIDNQGDAWRYTLGELERELIPRSSAQPSEHRATQAATPGCRAEAGPKTAVNAPRSYADSAALLGRRTAELHRALAQATDDPAFVPEPCTAGYWESLRDRMQRSVEGSLALLRRRVHNLGERDQQLAALILESEGLLLSRVEPLTKRSPRVLRIRCHGDFHLGQVLYTGGDFVIIDFEGEPARPLTERRAKHVPIVDVAGMVRSFHYAAYAALDRLRSEEGQEEYAQLEYRARDWYRSAADAFLSGYSETAGKAEFVPATTDERDMLLEVHLIEKACYELSYELNNRPGWAGIPLNGLLELREGTKK
jgi:maltose alpha-D-glucosyltransferase / alpha-amylase